MGLPSKNLARQMRPVLTMYLMPGTSESRTNYHEYRNRRMRQPEHLNFACERTPLTHCGFPENDGQ